MSPMKANPFIFFVEQRRREEEAETGRKYSLQEAVSKFGHVWMNMGPKEREPFIRRAGRKAGVQALESPAPPPPSDDETVVVVSKPKTAFEEAFKQKLDLLTDGAPTKIKAEFEQWLIHPAPVPVKIKNVAEPYLPPHLKEIQRQSWRRSQCHHITSDAFGDPTVHQFVLIHVTLYATTNDGGCIPGEIGVAVFSLEKGLLDNYTVLIDPGAPPLGYANQFLQSRRKHGLPAPPYNPEFADYRSIWNSLVRFLARHKTYETDNTYLFTQKDNVPIVQGALKWLADKAGQVVPWEIFSYGSLLFELSKLGRQRYITWIERQRRLDKVTNPNSRYALREAVATPKTDNEEFATDANFIDLASDRSSSSSVVTVIHRSSAGAGSFSSMDFQPPASHVSVCSWTPAEAALPDVDLSLMDTSVPPYPIPNYFSRARRIPQTSASRMSKVLEKIAATSGFDPMKGRSSSSVLTTQTPLAVPHDPATGNYRDRELFVTEEQANEFLESLDFASMVELSCPFHMVNTEGVVECPLNIVNRNVFNSLDVLIGYFHIPAREGTHYPNRDPAAEKFKRHQQVTFYTPCKYAPRLHEHSDSD